MASAPFLRHPDDLRLQFCLNYFLFQKYLDKCLDVPGSAASKGTNWKVLPGSNPNTRQGHRGCDRISVIVENKGDYHALSKARFGIVMVGKEAL
jgi:hypothetical protein